MRYRLPRSRAQTTHPPHCPHRVCVGVGAVAVEFGVLELVVKDDDKELVDE